jgi:hypothetical protein
MIWINSRAVQRLIRIKPLERNLANVLAKQGARERAMPTTDMIFVIAIILAFGAFAIVLGWTDFQTRRIGKRPSKRLE